MTVRCVGLFVLICATYANSGNFAEIEPDNVMPDTDVPVGQAEDNGHEDFVEVVDPEDGLDDIGDVGLMQQGFAKSEPQNVMPDADGMDNDGMDDDDMNDDFEDDEFDNDDNMDDEFDGDDFEDEPKGDDFA